MGLCIHALLQRKRVGWRRPPAWRGFNGHGSCLACDDFDVFAIVRQNPTVFEIRAQPALGLDRYGDRLPGGEGEFGESQAHPRAAIKTATGNQMLAVARSGLTWVRIGVLVRRVLVAAPTSVGLSSLRSLDKDGKKR